MERRGGVNTREQEEGIRVANIWNQSVCKRVRAVYMGKRNNKGERKKRKQNRMKCRKRDLRKRAKGDLRKRAKTKEGGEI